MENTGANAPCDAVALEIEQCLKRGMDDCEIVTTLRDKLCFDQSSIALAMASLGWGEDRVVAAFFPEAFPLDSSGES